MSSERRPRVGRRDFLLGAAVGSLASLESAVGLSQNRKAEQGVFVVPPIETEDPLLSAALTRFRDIFGSILIKDHNSELFQYVEKQLPAEEKTLRASHFRYLNLVTPDDRLNEAEELNLYESIHFDLSFPGTEDKDAE